MPPLCQPKTLLDKALDVCAQLTARAVAKKSDAGATLRDFLRSCLPLALFEPLMERLLQLAELMFQIHGVDQPKMVWIRSYLLGTLEALLHPQLSSLNVDVRINLDMLSDNDYNNKKLFDKSGRLAAIWKALEQANLRHFKLSAVALRVVADDWDRSQRDLHHEKQSALLSCFLSEGVLQCLTHKCSESLVILELANNPLGSCCSSSTLLGLLTPFQSLIELTLPHSECRNSDLIFQLWQCLPKLQYLHGVTCMVDAWSQWMRQHPDRRLQLRHFEQGQTSSRKLSSVMLSSVLECCSHIDTVRLSYSERACPDLDDIDTISCRAHEITRLEVEQLPELPPLLINSSLVIVTHFLGPSLRELDFFGVSWATVRLLARYAPNVTSVRVLSDLRQRYSEPSSPPAPDYRPQLFPKLREFILESADETFAEADLDALMKSACVSHLSTLAISTDLSWLTEAKLRTMLGQPSALQHLEALILHHHHGIDSDSGLSLGLVAVISIVRQCPKLSVLGELATWSAVDYFNPRSSKHRRSNSSFSRVCERARAMNWDLNLWASFEDLKRNWEKSSVVVR